MASTIESIGTTARTYTTIPAWEDAIPATPTDGYIGECYNDGSTDFTAGVKIAGHTTSATDFIKLTAASGESFQDHADVRTNALFYDVSKGVGVNVNEFASSVIRIDDDFVTVERIQIKRPGNSYGSSTIDITASLTSGVFKDCIIAKTYSAGDTIANIRSGKLINCLVYDAGGGASNGIATFNGGEIINCIIVRGVAAAGLGISVGGTFPLVKNTAIFGWSNDCSAGTYLSGSDYNATDDTTKNIPGANSTGSLTYASQFVSTTVDWRLKSGADLIDTGNTDATNAPNDISGTVRGTTTAGDIGAWEFVTSGQVIAVGQAIDTNTALVVAHAKTLSVLQVTDVETALVVSFGKIVSVIQAIENTTALSVAHAKALSLAQVTEIDTALTVTANRAILALQTTEVDSAFAVAHAKTLQIGRATEIDSAIVVTPVGGEIAVVSGNMIIPFARRRRR